MFRGEFLALGLALGLSWEHLFDVAVEKTAEVWATAGGTIPLDHTTEKVCLIILTIILVCIVFPAWTVYMMPKSNDKELKEFVKHLTEAGEELSPWQAFWDCQCCGDYDTYGHAEDEESEAESDQA